MQGACNGRLQILGPGKAGAGKPTFPSLDLGKERGLFRLGSDAILNEGENWLPALCLAILLVRCGEPGRLHCSISVAKDQHDDISLA